MKKQNKQRKVQRITALTLVSAFLFQQIAWAYPIISPSPLRLDSGQARLSTEKVPASFLLNSSYGKKNAGTFSLKESLDDWHGSTLSLDKLGTSLTTGGDLIAGTTRFLWFVVDLIRLLQLVAMGVLVFAVVWGFSRFCSQRRGVKK